MQNEIIYNPKCKKCQYRSGTPRLNGCDYALITRKIRGCPVKDCDKFIEGPRIRATEGISLEPSSEERSMMTSYLAEVMRRIGVPDYPPKLVVDKRHGGSRR